ncbi:DUF418 domain-containing protein [Thermoactinospora rubra]|uniref:DUF418 domain-containing protein n=1 Tax=Thermoactinospora rubra TaxID=1088767 RepID=UPI000A12310A|nr:DUF418 domain-containing protein [Thermoactinospora rubra]
MTQTLTQRVHQVDAVRGFALAGILIANIGFFADPRQSVLGAVPVTHDPVSFVVNTLVLSKFYVIFSFLFGYSFTLQMRAAERDGASVKGRTLRRCLGLFVIGLLHGFLLWIGDILTLYAALGVVLLLMRNVRPKTAVIIGSVILGVIAAALLLLAALSTLDPAAAAQPAGDPAEADRALRLATGGPLGFLRFQLETYPVLALFIWGFQGPPALAMFLFGLAAGKVRLLEDRERWAALLPRVQAVGFTVGLPCAVLFAWGTQGQGPLELVGLGLGTITSPLLAAAYVATLLRLPGLWPALAPAGRVAASNYVGQSVLCCLVFTGYGLALGGRLPPLAVMGVAASIYAVLLVLSAWWLRSHRYGPVEWVLRRITLCSEGRPPRR